VRVLQLYTSTRSFFENQVEALERRGVTCTTVGVPGSHDPEDPRTATDYLRYLPRVLGRSLDGYDLVHANLGLVGPFALAQPTRPVVLTLWGSDLMGERRWLGALSRASARAADAVVLPSPAMSPALSCEHAVVPFGIDLEQFRPIDRQRARERVGWDTEATVLLFPYHTGRPEKDYPRAERVVAAADVDVELRTVSGVPYREMPHYLNASDAVLVTSTRESGPMVVKEAAACDVPVVSTDVGFVREQLADVENSRVCTSDRELAAAIEAVVEGSARSNGREVLDGLGLDAMGERLTRLYGRVLDERGADRG
jgi:glycosyltransferase involved in cell wall biosynthesis